MELATKKKGLVVGAIVVCACLVLAVTAGIASGFSYVHTETEQEGSTSGTYHIITTVDRSAIGGDVTTGLVMIPASDPTVTAVLNEGTTTDESRVTTDEDTFYDYETTPLADDLAGSTYTIDVYEAGAEDIYEDEGTFYESDPIGDETYETLADYDTVYITVTG